MVDAGNIYERLSDPPDYVKAREWYEKGAGKGNARAMSRLGDVYKNGFGVAQDYAKAREWYEKAGALIDLGELYAHGLGGPQDYAKARELFQRAADKGEVHGMNNLVLLYANGLGGSKDYAKARELFQRAADKNDAVAHSLLRDLEHTLIREAAGGGRYAEALRLQEALAAKVEAPEIKREGKAGEETAQALHGVAWYALFAREFTKALTVADRAHALFPDDLAIQRKRAHALMFLEREKEAKALHLAHKGKPLSGQYGGKLWERAIVEDFAEFRMAGLTHPMMADIQKELGVSP
jgi:TPR repeat protein